MTLIRIESYSDGFSFGAFDDAASPVYFEDFYCARCQRCVVFISTTWGAPHDAMRVWQMEHNKAHDAHDALPWWKRWTHFVGEKL